MRATVTRAIVIIASVLAPPLAASWAEQPQAAIETALDAYVEGNYREAVAGAIRSGSLAALAQELRRQAPRWIDRAGPDQVARRRLVVASLGLEAAGATVLAIEDYRRDSHARATVELLEWGCDLVRRNSERLEAERAWHRAALAVIQRTGPSAAAFLVEIAEIVRRHIHHSEQRFPEDPRWRLARALLPYLDPMPPRVRSVLGGMEDTAKGTLTRAIRNLEPLLAEPSTQAEAHLRIGFLQFRLGMTDSALRHLDQSESSTTDPTLLYLARFFRGQILVHRGDLEGAAVAYESALQQSPNAVSSVTALAAIWSQHNRHRDAMQLVERALTAKNDDPWLSFADGDFRVWPQLRDTLRKALR